MGKKIICVSNTGFSVYNFRMHLLARLADEGWEVVVAANDEDNYQNRFEKKGFRFVDVDIDHKGKSILSDLSLVLELRRLYRREKPSLVHHFTIKPVIFGTLAARLARVPYIVNTITGLGYAFINENWVKKVVLALYWLAFSRNVKAIFQNSDDYDLFVSKHIIKSKNGYVILGSGIDTNEIQPITHAMDVNDRQICFLLIGRMLWSKGVEDFVKAAETLKQKYSKVKFIMAGGASGGGAVGNPDAIPENWLRAVSQAGYVKWLGRLSFHEVLALLDHSSVFVLPSYYPEGIPRSLIEAAGKGKPIITTDTPGCREVVEEGLNGFLVPPKDPKALASAMCEFVRDPSLVHKMGIESRKIAVEIFDEQIILKQTFGVYKASGAFNCQTNYSRISR